MEHAACSSISSRTPCDGGAEMRREDGPLPDREQRLGYRARSIPERLVLEFEYIRGVSTEPTPGDSSGDRLLVDDRAPSDVDETTPGSYAPQGIGVDQMPRIRRKRGGAHDEVTRLEQLVQTRDVQVQPGSSPRIGWFGVDAENPGAAKSAETFRHRDSHSARTQDPHRAPVKPPHRRERDASPGTHRFARSDRRVRRCGRERSAAPPRVRPSGSSAGREPP